MRTINLDEARAAREEAQGAGIEVIFRGQKFTLPSEIPSGIVELAADLEDVQKRHKAARGDLKKSLQAEMARQMMALMAELLGPEEWPRFARARPSVDDLAALLNGAFEEYGSGLGESPASGSSSARTGGSSRPTSRGSIPGSATATSGRSAGARKPSAHAAS